MSEKSGKSRDADRKKTTISKKVLIVIGVVIVISIIAIAGFVLLKNGTTTQDSSDSFTKAGALYTESVNLANAGKYQDAIDKADAALAYNVSSLIPLIQSNRAGILRDAGPEQRGDRGCGCCDQCTREPDDAPIDRVVQHRVMLSPHLAGPRKPMLPMPTLPHSTRP